MSEHPKASLLGALTRKAKEGGPEGDNARKALERVCKKYGLEMDAVLADDTELVEEYTLDYKTGHHDLAVQIICRYALTPKYQDIRGFRNRLDGKPTNKMSFKCTRDRYIETLHAYDVLGPLYNQERKRVMDAYKYGFYSKHNLFPQFDTEDSPDTDPVDMQAALRGQRMAADMDDADLTPRLPVNSLESKN